MTDQAASTNESLSITRNSIWRKCLVRFLKSDITLCVFLVLFSIILHSFSRSLNGVSEDAREEYLTESGLPYLTEMDSYCYYRLTKEIVDEGFFTFLQRYESSNGVRTRGISDVVLALPILGATTYRLLSWIPGLTLYHVVYFLAPFFTSLTIIPIFIFIRRHGGSLSRVGGLVGSLLIVTASPFSWHTHAGFYDTDMGLALLPSLFLLCFIEAILARTLKHQLLWSLGSGLSLCIFSVFWRGYYPYFCVGAAAAFCVTIALLIYRLFRGHWLQKGMIRGAIMGLSSQILFCLLSHGFTFISQVLNVLRLVNYTQTDGDPSFPLASQYITEYEKIPLLAVNYGRQEKLINGFAAYAKGMLNYLGAWPVLIVVAITLLVLWSNCCRILLTNAKTDTALGRKDKTTPTTNTKNASPFVLTIFLSVWLVCGLIIMFNGVRYIAIPVIPLSIICGLGVSFFSQKIHIKGKDLSKPLFFAIILLSCLGARYGLQPEYGETIGIIAECTVLTIGILLFFLRKTAIVYLLAFILILTPCITCFRNAYYAVPSSNDTLQEMCDNIREKTDPDAAIVSWWDLGYFYEISAQRYTICDGGFGKSNELHYWVGQALLTDDLLLAEGIFRMLSIPGEKTSHGGLDAMHLLMDIYKEEGDDYALRATAVIKQILVLSKDEALRALTAPTYEASLISVADRIDKTTAETLLRYTHPDQTRPTYLILSEDMLRKTNSIGTFGYWDFKKITKLPIIRRSEHSYMINPGDTIIIPLDYNSFTVQLTRNPDGSFVVNELKDTYGRILENSLRVVPCNENSLSWNDPANCLTTATKDAIPSIQQPPDAPYTVYLREDSPSSFRCIVCSSFAADSILVRGFALNGENLFYRSVCDMSKSAGNPATHEVAVWKLSE